MDNLLTHKVQAIAPLIEAVGANISHLFTYSPEFSFQNFVILVARQFLRKKDLSPRPKVD